MTLSRKAKEAIKTALAMTIAYGIALSMNWDKPMWAGFAVAFVSLTTVGQSFNKAAMRMFGTLVAAVVALWLIALFPQERWLFMLCLSAWVGFCTYMMGAAKNQYFWNVCGFVCVIVCMDTGPNPTNAFHMAILRTQETGLGILVYSLVALFLWPSSSRAAFDEAARQLASTQHELYRAYLGLMSSQEGVGEGQALRAQMVQVKTRFDQLLDAAETDSIEVRELRRQWRRYQRQAADLTQTMERWRESFAEVQALDLPRLLPNLAAFGSELDLRLAQLKRMLAGQDPEQDPAAVELSWDETEVRALSHFHQAAAAVTRTSLQRIEALTRSMFESVSDIQGLRRARVEGDVAPPARAGFAPDPDRLISVVRVVATMWLAYLVFIYVDDIPGGTGFVTMSSTLGMILATKPQMSVSLLHVPIAVGIFAAGLLYIFLMPQLSSFLGLGLLLFAVTFAYCYLFSQPRQALGRAFGLAMFASIAAISNEQTYSFLGVAVTTLMFLLIFLLLAITSYIPVSPLPERAFLRLLGRFFHSCEYLMSTVHRGTQRGAMRLMGWRRSFHAREVATLPRKLEVWGHFIDPKSLPGTSPQQVQGVATSLQALSYRMQAVLEAGGVPQAEFLKQELREDVRTWRRKVQETFKSLSKDPAAGERETFRIRLTEMMERLEARIEETLDKAAEGQLRDQDSEHFYLLMGAYRGLSEALVDYAANAGCVDWAQWREERFA